MLTFGVKSHDTPLNYAVSGRGRPAEVGGGWLGNGQEAGQAADDRGKEVKPTAVTAF